MQQLVEMSESPPAEPKYSIEKRRLYGECIRMEGLVDAIDVSTPRDKRMRKQMVGIVSRMLDRLERI